MSRHILTVEGLLGHGRPRAQMLMRGTACILGFTLAALAVPASARERVVHLKIGPFRIEAHRDREVCQAVRIPHARGLDVVAGNPYS